MKTDTAPPFWYKTICTSLLVGKVPLMSVYMPHSWDEDETDYDAAMIIVNRVKHKSRRDGATKFLIERDLFSSACTWG